MRPRPTVLAVLVLFGSMFLVGCNGWHPDPTPVAWAPLPDVAPLQTYTATPSATLAPTETSLPTSTPTRTPTAVPSATPDFPAIRAVATEARDRAWAHLLDIYPHSGLTTAPEWQEEGIEWFESGSQIYYVAGDWVIAVDVPRTLPEERLAVALAGPSSFAWEADVDLTSGEVSSQETPIFATPTPEMLADEGGILTRAPADAPFLAYVTWRSGEVWEILATSRQLADEIAALAGTGQTVRLWGAVERTQEPEALPRLVVDRLATIRPTYTPVPPSEFVQAWEGQIRTVNSLDHDDYFEREPLGDRYGIASLNDQISEFLISYRDTGMVVRIWGILDYGVNDYAGRRIVVSRLEELGIR